MPITPVYGLNENFRCGRVADLKPLDVSVGVSNRVCTEFQRVCGYLHIRRDIRDPDTFAIVGLTDAVHASGDKITYQADDLVDHKRTNRIWFELSFMQAEHSSS